MKLCKTSYKNGVTYITIRTNDDREYFVITVKGLHDVSMNLNGTAMSIKNENAVRVDRDMNAEIPKGLSAEQMDEICNQKEDQQ